MTSLKPVREHRPDVQGLRALAVTAVVLYHLWPGLVPGGYVGVDVFFVISGFLITGLLFREMAETGRLRLLAFYARRIRRLLPSAFIVLACTLVVLVLVAPRVVWHQNLVQIRAAAAYVLNWQLAAERTDYLGAGGSPTLVQHYWSLALEEQFYLVWPLLLILTLAWGVRRLTIGLRASLAIMLGITATASFVLSVTTTSEAPAFAFFATQSRAWEFALGGLVALLPAVSWRPLVGWVTGWVGVGLVVIACMLLDHDTTFPGWATLVPTVGTALVLTAGALALSGSTSRVLGWPAFGWLGDHSYAIYLWHWPLIVTAPWILEGAVGNAAKLCILAATLVLGWLTTRYVEDPVRSGPAWQARRWASIGLATAGAAALVLATIGVSTELDRVTDQQADLALASVKNDVPCFGASAWPSKECAQPFATPSADTVAFAAGDFASILNTCQLAPDEPSRPRWCEFGSARPDARTVAVIGNSIATELVPLLRQWAGDKNLRILLAARTDCLGLVTGPVVGQAPDDRCVAWSQQVQSRLLSLRALSLVVFVTHERSAEFLTGQTMPSPEARSDAQTRVLGSLRLLRDAGIARLVVKHPPGPYPFRVPECIALSSAAYDPCTQPRKAMTRMDLLAATASRHPRATRFVSLDRYFCDELRCHTVIGGVVAYFDDRHLTKTYARTMARHLGPVLSAATSLRPPPPPHGW
ncbi:MAG TPA: acyltransferase family protein [Nocardioides sp.]|nr:acyltransferase family protein [Nocardioides sp.]